MNENIGYRLLTKLYVFSRVAREVLLQSVFGWVSQCKHTPSCGEYTMECIKKEGLLSGTLKGCSRILRCW